MESEIRWQPLEANPDVMNSYASTIGLSSGWEFVDVLSLELLDMIPRPCCAFVFLFPITENYVKHSEKEQRGIEDPKVYFMKQTIGNACGTIALVHSIANNRKRPMLLKDESVLKSFFDATNDMTPEKRGKKLESNEEISKAHQTSAQCGQSREIAADEHVDLHFVAIVNVGGKIYELDGRKPLPVEHGNCPNEDEFVTKAADVCRGFIERDPDQTRFSIVALVQKQD